jgi:hypothetical protein
MEAFAAKPAEEQAVSGHTLALSLVTGEEEVDYHRKLAGDGGGRGGRGGRGAEGAAALVAGVAGEAGSAATSGASAAVVVAEESAAGTREPLWPVLPGEG